MGFGARSGNLSQLRELTQQHVNGAVAVERIAPPGLGKVTVLAQRVNRGSQLLLRGIEARPPQDAAWPLRRVHEDSLQPAFERFISQCVSFLFRDHLEDGVDAGLDRPLTKKVAAEGM